MTEEDQGPHDQMMGTMCETQSWGLSNCENTGGIKENSTVKPLNQGDGGNEGEALMNNKRSRGNASGTEKNVVISGEARHGKRLESEHEMHIWTERERRKKMRNMFASLHALLPQLPSKADKSTIVDEAVSYIKNLEQTLEKLEKQKQERLQSVSTFGCESSVMNSQWHPYDSRQAFITANQGPSNNVSSAMVTSNPSNSLSSPEQPIAFQTWTSPNVVLNICGDEAQFCIWAAKKPGLFTTIAFVLEKHNIDVISANILCNGNGNGYMILARAKRASHSFSGANSVEETYRQAAGEIMIWIT
ncbi:transcription factor bHLH95 [Gastrolobium bilobum]|uniref:transcription factor bHLH95 n=1 Tax=Gastrolobium bilobum TaxID=150636 RepID=UPI002AAF3C33|nr:transcription factor bHLH95 [Gastrolobium bilobum]